MFSKKTTKSHSKNQEPLPKGALLTPPENLYIPESHFVPETQYLSDQQYIVEQQSNPTLDNSYRPQPGCAPESDYLQEPTYYMAEQMQMNQAPPETNSMGSPRAPSLTINAAQHNLANPSQAPQPTLPSESARGEPYKTDHNMIFPLDSVNVKILFDGYSKFVNGDYFANCTCTLIKGGPNIIIDTMTVWDEEKLLRSLRNEGLACDDIDFVICTHGHSDHTGCNHLFKKAIHIVGFSISHKDQYYLHPDFRRGEEFNIDPSTNAIKIIPTPGHTLQDVTILIYTNIGTIAITGDLFEKAEDLENECEWLQAGSDNASLQRRNRQKVLELADYIIPGHGPIFKVPDRIKKNCGFKAC